MRAPCEELTRYLLPALRGALAAYMYVERGMRQADIAKVVGVSQSAISRYVNMERGLYRRIVERVPEVRGALEDVAQRLERGERISLCEVCKRLQEERLLDKLTEVIQVSGGRRALQPSPSHLSVSCSDDLATP